VCGNLAASPGTSDCDEYRNAMLQSDEIMETAEKGTSEQGRGPY
jgi:hypothetical protein